MKLPDKIIVKIQQFVTSMVYLSFIVSFSSFVIHSQDINYSDRILFFILAVMRYSSFVLCICSLYKLLVNIFHFFRRPSLSRVMKNVFYLIFIAYGVFIIFFESFVTVIAGGNE
jgi:threonine/homoserine/homoserine lactone efflux protein